MADGFDIHLTEDQALRLKVVAEAAPADYALQVLEQAIGDDWTEEARRLAAYDRSGEAVPVEEALSVFRSDLADRLAAGQ
ncbi:hypothetical protein [uncultured Brevundimonas sp.]|uniref:hypothetical protein n=1 Tax=uncultured Brevundimonas sp. TaxID=213418 RepID=UPI0030EBEE0B|tara:strand:+ start:19485 stop:19724 length:240 start_codon:yes stop_codon:yes gene_type:complete